MGSSSSRGFHVNIVTLYIVMLSALSLLLYLKIAVLSVTHVDISLDFGEGPIIYESWLLSRGDSFYFPYVNSHDLVLVVPYPPLFQLVTAILIRFGIAPLSAARLVSITSTLALAFVVYKILTKLNVDKKLSLLMSALLLSIPIVFVWSPLARVDILGVFFSILGLYFIVEENWYLAFGAMGLALLTKQSFISLPLVAGLYLLKRNRYLQFAIMIGITAIPHLFLALTVPYYVDNVIYANLYQHLNFDIFFNGLEILAIGYWAIIALAVYSYKYISQVSQHLDSKYEILGQYLAVSLGMSILTYSKPGSTVNYFIEPIVIAWILISLLLEKSKSEHALNSLCSMLLLGLVMSSVFIDGSILQRYESRLNYDYSEMYHDLRSFQPPVFFEDPYVAFKSGNGNVTDIFLLTQLAKVGVWNQTKIINMIRHQNFSAIVTMMPLDTYPVHSPNSRYSEEMVKTILEYYELWKTYPGYYIYLPISNTTCSVGVKI